MCKTFRRNFVFSHQQRRWAVTLEMEQRLKEMEDKMTGQRKQRIGNENASANQQKIKQKEKYEIKIKLFFYNNSFPIIYL